MNPQNYCPIIFNIESYDAPDPRSPIPDPRSPIPDPRSRITDTAHPQRRPILPFVMCEANALFRLDVVGNDFAIHLGAEYQALNERLLVIDPISFRGVDHPITVG